MVFLALMLTFKYKMVLGPLPWACPQPWQMRCTAGELKAPSCSILLENHLQAQIYKQDLQEQKAAWLDSFGMATKIPGVDAH